MSVLIKGMTMPDMCSKCDFLGGLIYPDGIYVCECPVDTIHGRNVQRAVEEDSRHSHCPLGKIPESHGPLIDRNKLCESLDLDAGIIKNINEEIPLAKDSDLNSFVHKIIERVYKSIRDDLVLKMPVVVEAEGELLKPRKRNE